MRRFLWALVAVVLIDAPAAAARYGPDPSDNLAVTPWVGLPLAGIMLYGVWHKLIEPHWGDWGDRKLLTGLAIAAALVPLILLMLVSVAATIFGYD